MRRALMTVSIDETEQRDGIVQCERCGQTFVLPLTITTDEPAIRAHAMIQALQRHAIEKPGCAT